MPHLVLLGDSIFDNAQYTSGGPDVVSQVRNLLPSGWCASLLAVDGSTTVNIPDRSEEHTSELQSQSNLVCRLLLEKKNKQSQRCTSIALPLHPASSTHPDLSTWMGRPLWYLGRLTAYVIAPNACPLRSRTRHTPVT